MLTRNDRSEEVFENLFTNRKGSKPSLESTEATYSNEHQSEFEPLSFDKGTTLSVDDQTNSEKNSLKRGEGEDLLAYAERLDKINEENKMRIQSAKYMDGNAGRDGKHSLTKKK